MQPPTAAPPPGARFINLEPEAPSTTFLLEYAVRQFTGDELREPPTPLPVLAVDKKTLAESLPPSGLRAFWIGHASTYVEVDGLRMLLDPVFAERVSPLPVGPRRMYPSPIRLVDLPRIDAVLISHDRNDHLDMDTVRHLAQRGSRFFVPLGIGAHLERWGVPRHRFFYSGETGYGTLFQDIGARLGPFDMAFIKVGAYGPSQGWIAIHMTPEQAMQVHRDARPPPVSCALVHVQSRLPRVARAYRQRGRRRARRRHRPGDASGGRTGGCGPAFCIEPMVGRRQVTCATST